MSLEEKAQDYLKQEGIAHPEQKEIFSQLSELHHSRLWYQLGLKLVELTALPYFQTAPVLLTMYERFVSSFQLKINVLDLVRFTNAASKQCADPPAALKFLDTIAKVVSENKEALLLCNLQIIHVHLQSGKVEECKKLIEDCKAMVAAYQGLLDPQIHSTYYRVLLEYHKIRGTAGEFYQNSLLYLAYTPLSTIPSDEAVRLASDLGLAALVGNVYNFGELLKHPILKSLEGTEHAWLADLLHSFNAGDIKKFEDMLEQKNPSQESLLKSRVFLTQKIRIMALMEMVFQRGSHDRTIPFKDISRTCRVPVQEVELLLMKAFSLKVVRGVIDQVDKTVRIQWVQPRVLDMKQIVSMRDRMKDWTKKVDEATNYITKNAPELVVV